MVERKDQVHTPDLTKEVGFVFCASRSESSYNAITPKSSYDSGSVITPDVILKN